MGNPALSVSVSRPISDSNLSGVHTAYVPVRALPRTQLVDVECMVPPAPEHSQTDLLTSESICGTWYCPAEGESGIFTRHLEPRSVEVDDEKICQTCKDN